MPRHPDQLDDREPRPRRGSRPRSKLRPSHASAEPGLVTAVDRGRFTCWVSGRGDREVMAMKAREIGRRGVVVGDVVRLEGNLSGEPGALARIVTVESRRNELRRTADDSDPHERVVVANVDLMAIVTAAADPPPRPGLIDRCLVAALDAGITPLLLLTKLDLSHPAELIRTYGPLDVDVVEAEGPEGIDRLRERMAKRATVLVGHSGVGKSTLANALVPDGCRTTGAVNRTTGRGTHTSTSVEAMLLPGGGWVIDTPGIRSFGLAHVSRDRVIAAFSELAEGTAGCPRACAHANSDCALDSWVEAGAADAKRLSSLRRILSAVDR